MRGRAERDRARQPQRGLDVGQHHRRRAVGDQRTIGALEWTSDKRILVGSVAAELETKILAQLRIRIADAVLMILGGDRGERIGLVTPTLEIEAGDFSENPGK